MQLILIAGQARGPAKRNHHDSAADPALSADAGI
jgi:hypothetical protein